MDGGAGGAVGVEEDVRELLIKEGVLIGKPWDPIRKFESVCWKAISHHTSNFLKYLSHFQKGGGAANRDGKRRRETFFPSIELSNTGAGREMRCRRLISPVGTSSAGIPSWTASAGIPRGGTHGQAGQGPRSCCQGPSGARPASQSSPGGFGNKNCVNSILCIWGELLSLEIIRIQIKLSELKTFGFKKINFELYFLFGKL